ncbi:MAG: hypothetical protein IJF17_15190 [Thermoguttaceae bacterium]|nr:hypothetical protein [Thermoguttaceae bacterium]MDO4425558.1 hypothetical protein [Planctomycetia bacterium]
MLNVVILFIFAAVLGAALRDSLWSNTIRFFNVLFGALAASTLGPSIAAMLRGIAPSRAFFFYFLAMWLVFWVVCGLLQVTTNKLSRVKVKFDPKVDLYGGYAAAFLMACVFTSFTMFTLHQAPLAKSFMFKSFNSSERMILGTAPDRQWYTFYAYVGGGAMGGSQEAKDFEAYRRGCDSFRGAVEDNVKKTGTTGIANTASFK